MQPKFKTQTKIKKPVAEVFRAVHDPEILCRYFTKTADAPFREGQTSNWSWHGYPHEIPIHVRQVIENKLIVFEWASGMNSKNMIEVRMTFSELKAGETLFEIEETGFQSTQQELDNAFDHCEGWQHMATCLKAFLEYGIDLRYIEAA